MTAHTPGGNTPMTRRTLLGAAAGALAGPVLPVAGAAAAPATPPMPGPTPGDAPGRALPDPAPLGLSLEVCLQSRRSARAFADRPVEDAQLAAVLRAAAGRTRSDGLRTVPSALNCQAVHAYVFDARGVWFYDAARHTLVQKTSNDARAATTLGQAFVAGAPVTIVFVADLKRARLRLRPEGLQNCISVEAGCMVQAGQLACTALGLASVPRASLDPAAVRKAAALTEDDLALMALTLGHPA